MIIKGNIRMDGSDLGDYLLSEGYYAKNQGENEQMSIWEAFGIEQGHRLQDILADFEYGAAGTKCTKPLFHVQMRTADGEELTQEQWLESISRLEEKLKLTGHERVIVAHTKDGHEHLHIAWTRIDHEQQKAADLHYYKHKCTDLARELEQEFGLRELGERGKGKLSHGEEQQAARKGAKPHEIKEAIQACWAQSDSGKAFAAALEERGLILARGDRRDFVIVDEQGCEYSVARATGSRAAEVRDKLGDLDRAQLPGVDEAKDLQQERGGKTGEHYEGEEAATMSENDKKKNYDELKKLHSDLAQAEEQKKEAIAKEEELKKELWTEYERKKAESMKDDDQKKEAAQKDEDQRKEALQKDEDRKQQARQDDARKQETQRLEQLAKENSEKQVQQLQEMQRMQEQQARFQAHRDQMEREAAAAQQHAREQEAAQREGHIHNAHDRYAQSLAKHYDVRDPYRSLARSAMHEYGSFMRDRAALDGQLAETKDPAVRQGLELRKQIEGAEYMAITNDRIAAQSEIITGKLKNEEAQRLRAEAVDYREQAKELRAQWRELQTVREGPNSPPPPDPPSKGGEKTKPFEKEPEPKPSAPLMVRDRDAEIEPMPLKEFVCNLPELKQKESARPDLAEKMAERKRNAALDKIDRQIQGNRPIEANDVRNLKPEDRAGIRKNGDEHVRAMISERKKERKHEPGQSQERER